MPAVHIPSTSLIVRPASSSAPRILSAMIWNMLLSGAKRLGCSNTPTTAVLRLRLIVHSVETIRESTQLVEELLYGCVDNVRTLSRQKVARVRNHLEACALNPIFQELGVCRRCYGVIGPGQDQSRLVQLAYPV